MSRCLFPLILISTLSACVADSGSGSENTLQLQRSDLANASSDLNSQQAFTNSGSLADEPQGQVSASGSIASIQSQQGNSSAMQQTAAAAADKANAASNAKATSQNQTAANSNNSTANGSKSGSNISESQLAAAQRALETSHAAAKADTTQLALAGAIPESVSASNALGQKAVTAATQAPAVTNALAEQSQVAPKASAAVDQSLNQSLDQSRAKAGSNSQALAATNPETGAPSKPSSSNAAKETPQGFFSKLLAANEAASSTAKNSAKSRNSQRIASLPSENSRRSSTNSNSARNARSTSNSRRTDSSSSGLPGVRSRNQIFGIEESHEEMEERPSLSLRSRSASEESESYQVASAAGIGAAVVNGLRVQTSRVNVSCIKPDVIRILNTVERKFGQKPIITSGYRSPNRNRRAGGARNSMHIYCKAVDIQVPGVSKWTLAKYLRSLPNVGGVGTYCRTKSVHVDTGKRRDWNQPCRRSTKHRRKKA